MSSAKDRLAWQNLVTNEPPETVDDARRILAKARTKTALGSGYELKAIAGNDTALAGLSLWMAHERAGSANASVEQRLQRGAGVSMPVFRSSMQELKRAFGMATQTTPSRSSRSSPRKSGTGSATTTPTKAPSSASKGKGRATPARSGDEGSEDEMVVVMARKTPVTTPTKAATQGSRRTSARKAAAIDSLARGSGSRHAAFEPDAVALDSRKRGRSAASHVSEPGADEEPITPTKKRVRPSRGVTTPQKQPTRKATPPPPEPRSIFDSEYVPLPSQKDRWNEAPWHIDYDDLMWRYNAQEEAERVEVLEQWDRWHTAKVFKENSWQIPTPSSP